MKDGSLVGNDTFKYDVVVVGGGHAGCEAALAAARIGAETLLITMNMDHIAQMSCNPAIGGIAKGQVVREIDALGGAMARVADAATIQFRMLNKGKGPAVWSPRAQCDKQCYQRAMKRELEIQPNLIIHQAEVVRIIVENGAVAGIATQFDDVFKATSFVICSGTFLKGRTFYGPKNFEAGRAGDAASNKLSISLAEDLELTLGRLKTGTPPRILAKTIDFSKMSLQEAELGAEGFSYYPSDDVKPSAFRRDLPCHLVKSTEKTAAIVRENIKRSPLYAGDISGIGTRYCPSFEDKVMRFPHHPTHQLYLEPEGESTEEYYINGISSSLPVDVQIAMITSIPGMENARISRYAYAIEYDFVFPHQMLRTLALKKWPNLFLAGQINGTSGYEEAGGQGLLAGLNAARSAAGKSTVELGRDSSYIGVMIDDLVSKDITEPYRLFTSRAEYRLRLRQDNADLRLSPMAVELGLLSAEKVSAFKVYSAKLAEAERLSETSTYEGMSVLALLKNLRGESSESHPPFPPSLLSLDLSSPMDRRVWRQLVVNEHYRCYLEREKASVAKLRKLEEWTIPVDFAYSKVKGLRNESRMKLEKVLPSTLAQASRIDGVTPAEISLLQVHLKRSELQLNSIKS